MSEAERQMGGLRACPGLPVDRGLPPEMACFDADEREGVRLVEGLFLPAKFGGDGVIDDAPGLDVPAVRVEVGSEDGVGKAGFADVRDAPCSQPVAHLDLVGGSDFVSVATFDAFGLPS